MYVVVNRIIDSKIIELNNELNNINTSYDKYNAIQEKLNMILEDYKSLLNLSTTELDNIGYKLIGNDKLYLESYKKILFSDTYVLGDFDKKIINNIITKINNYVNIQKEEINILRKDKQILLKKYNLLKEKLPKFDFNGEDIRSIYELLKDFKDTDYAIEIMKYITINSMNRFSDNLVKDISSINNEVQEEKRSVISEEELVNLFNKYGIDYNWYNKRTKDNFLKYGVLNNIESNLVSFKNNGYGICESYIKNYGYQVSEILMYGNNNTINSVFNTLKECNANIIMDKLLAYPNIFYDKEALRKIFKDKYTIISYGNENFIKNILLFNGMNGDINKYITKSFLYLTISNDVIKTGIKNFELYGIDRNKYLNNLSCFATDNQLDNLDRFIELGAFDYASKNVSKLSCPTDSLIFYKLKFIKQMGLDIKDYYIGNGLSSDISYDYKDFRIKDDVINDRNSARELTKTYNIPIPEKSIYEEVENILKKNDNNDMDVIFKMNSSLVNLLDKKYLVYVDDGIDKIPDNRLYNVNGVNVSRYKVLRYLNTLIKNNIEIDSNILTYIMNRNSINTYEEFNLVKDEITRLYSDIHIERSV